MTEPTPSQREPQLELKAAAALVGLVATNTLLGTDLDDDDREFFEACKLLADGTGGQG